LAVALNGFLDQDSMVVASQALRVARAEAGEAAKEEEEKRGREEGNKIAPSPSSSSPSSSSSSSRSHLSRSLFAFRSPTETFLASVATWFDAALPSAPGRDASSLAALVAKLESSSGNNVGGFPDRKQVLDRFRYHTELVPSSKKVWERAKRVGEASRAVALVAAAAAFATAATTATTASGGGAAAAAAAALPALLLSVAAALSSLAADTVASRFEYCYTRERQARDLGRIAALAPEVEAASKEAPV
jgi:hypothetical protein